jgi:hypothetical protein
LARTAGRNRGREIIAAPPLWYATLNPDVDNLPSFSTSFYNPEETLIDRVQGNLPIVLGQFTVAGDNTWEFNMPGRPIFEPVMAALFLLGVAVAVAHFRSPPHIFLLIALAVSLLPSIMFDANFAFARLVSGQPATFALVALGIDALLRGIQRIVPARTYPAVSVLVTCGLLAATAINTMRDMFVAWPAQANAPDVQCRVSGAGKLSDSIRRAAGGAVHVGSLSLAAALSCFAAARRHGALCAAPRCGHSLARLPLQPGDSSWRTIHLCTSGP